LTNLPVSIDLYRPDFKVDANGRDVVARERVVGEPHEERALPDARVADDEQLEEVVVVLAGGMAQGHREAGEMGHAVSSKEVSFKTTLRIAAKKTKHISLCGPFVTFKFSRLDI
jgi:hypothetical protein